MAHFEFVIVKDNKGQVRPSPDFLAKLTAAGRLNIGDTVRFSSPEGQIKVEIVSGTTPATPFREPGTTITDPNRTYNVAQNGQFSFHCMLKGPGDPGFVGWPEHGDAAGADSPTKPPRVVGP